MALNIAPPSAQHYLSQSTEITTQYSLFEVPLIDAATQLA
jgi:hypothetical protein